MNSGSFDPLAHYREDVKVTMASSGLYDWLLKVVSVSGAIGGEGEELAGAAAGVDAVDEGGKDKEKERKQLQGGSFHILFPLFFTDDLHQGLTLWRWTTPSSSPSHSSSPARRSCDTNSSSGSSST